MPIGIALSPCFTLSSIWNPSRIIGQYGGLWLDPNWQSAINLNTQPTMSDLDMEAADVGAWGSFGATIAKSVDAHSGSKSLAITATASPFAAANQNVGAFVSGNRYAIDCWAKSDGIYNLVGQDGGGTTLYTVAGTGAWQNIIADGTLTNAQFNLRHQGANGKVAKYDDVNLSNISIASTAFRAKSPAFAAISLSQATPSLMPWKTTTLYNGNQTISTNVDFLTSNAFDAVTPPITVVMVMKASGGLVWHDSPTGNRAQITVKLTDDADSYIYNSTFLYYPYGNDTNWAILIAEFNGANSRVLKNGLEVTRGSTGTNAITTIGLMGQAAHFNAVGEMGDYLFIPNILSESDLTALTRYLANKWNITLV